MEYLNHGSAYRRASKDDHAVLTPRKVSCPTLASWIKEWYDASNSRKASNPSNHAHLTVGFS